MDAPAAQLAHAVVHSGQRPLAIFDFAGPGNHVNELGQRLADDLRRAIAKSAPDLPLQEWQKIEQQRVENSYAPEMVLDPHAALLFAQELGARAFIVGQMSVRDGSVLVLELKAYRVDNGKGIKGLSVSFSMNEEMKSLLPKVVAAFDPVTMPFPNFPRAKSAGYSAPSCLYCPRAEYPGEAMDHGVEGAVILLAVVREDGRVADIAVLRGLPGGLTAKAIEAVKRWKLAPATGPDGRSAAVRVPIEVEFHLY